MIKKIIVYIILLCVFISRVALAEPSPFGIEINKTAISEVKNKFTCKDYGINKYSNGPMCELDSTKLGFDGSESVRVIFDKDSKVLAVLTVFNKDQYDNLLHMLSNKYQLVSNQNPFVGNKLAEFKNETTRIILDAPHMSFALSLNYINKDLYEKFLQQESEEQENKFKKNQRQL